MDKFKEKLEKIENKDKNKKDVVNNDDTISKTGKKINDTNLFVNALEYYDRNSEKYADKLNNVHYYNIEVAEDDLHHDVIHCYDSDFKEIFKSRFELIGIHEKFSHIWTWGWSMPNVRKGVINIIRKILIYGTELDPTASILKSELITSRFIITNDIQLDIHCAIASYLSKKDIIFKYNMFGSSEITKKDGVDYINNMHGDYSIKVNNDFQLVNYIFLLDPI